MTAVVASWGAQLHLKMTSRDMMQTSLSVLVEHPSPAVIDAVSFLDTCIEKAHRAMGRLALVDDCKHCVSTVALTIGAKPQHAEDKSTIDYQAKDIKKLRRGRKSRKSTGASATESSSTRRARRSPPKPPSSTYTKC